ncbi:MAG TPA: hypothetical protein VES65_11510 [Solirubrobacteraceae bacterium]|nr:hypothetical protein [Solirubrobacteraceae bacterium]
MARRVAVDLTPQAVEQVASRVAQLLHRQQEDQERRRMSEPTGMLTVSQLAQHLHLNRAWVYEHADELGAIRLGDGPKARLRFDLRTAKTALGQHQAGRTPAPAGTKPHRPTRLPATEDAQLLEVRRRDIRRTRSCVPAGRRSIGGC